MTNAGDPVGAGLVASLARPGGNVTGLSSLSPELNSKRLEVLKDAVPNLARVGLLRTSSTSRQLKEIRPAAQAAGMPRCIPKWRNAGEHPGILSVEFSQAAAPQRDGMEREGEP